MSARSVTHISDEELEPNKGVCCELIGT